MSDGDDTSSLTEEIRGLREEVRNLKGEIRRSFFEEGLDGNPPFYHQLKELTEEKDRIKWLLAKLGRLALMGMTAGAIWASFRADILAWMAGG